MKKLLIGMFLLIALLVPFMAGAEETAKDEGFTPPDKKEVNVEQMLERMEAHKAKMLENIKSRFAKLNERLATFGERIDKLSDRMGKLRTGGETGSEQAGGAAKITESEEKLKERKAKVTERYNTFKKNIEGRKVQLTERMEANHAKFMKRIEKLSAADKDRLIAAREKVAAEVKAEAQKLADEAMAKLEATYQKLMSL